MSAAPYPSHAQVREGVAVVTAAYELNPSNGIDKVMAWYRDHRISELGGKSAHELVCEGRANQVLAYLKSLEG